MIIHNQYMVAFKGYIKRFNTYIPTHIPTHIPRIIIKQ